jgi:DNA-binding transcriptional regulator of glucitol operon
VDRRFLRPGWIAGHLLVLAAVLVCLRLGWWQWERAHESDGTAQNLGYALLWPAFAAAFIYMWIRFLRLEKLKQAEDDEQADAGLAELLAEIDPPQPPPADPTGAVVDAESAVPGDEAPSGRGRRPAPPDQVVLSVATVEEEYPDDPELTTYNRALAALAEEDRRRARRSRR